MENHASPDRVHGMLVAHSALLFALVRTLECDKLEQLLVAYAEESEATTAFIHNLPCSETMRDAFQVQLNSQLSLLNSYRT